MSAAEKSGSRGRTGRFRSKSAGPATGPAIAGANESGRSRDASTGDARRKIATQQTTTADRTDRVLAS